MKPRNLSLMGLIALFAMSSCGGSPAPSSSSSSERSSSSEPSSSQSESSESSSSSSSRESSSSSSPSSEPAASSSAEQAPFVFPDVITPTVKEDGDYSFSPILSEGLPKISIVSEDGKNDFATVPSRGNKWDYVNCTVSISDCEEKYQASGLTGGVKVRGNYTSNYDKKPLRFKFDKKQSMLGLNNGQKMKSWVLLAEVKDSSLLRNSTAFYLGKKILGSDGYYVSDFRPVNVEINGQYWGVYILAEQQQVNAARVDITEPEDDCTTNDIGYLVEYDGYYTEETGPDADPTFTINYNNGARLTGPNGSQVRPGNRGYTVKSDITANSQLSFASTYLENVYRVAYNAKSGNYYDISSDGLSLVKANASSKKDHIGKYIDLNSMVDTYLLQEIACDPDIAWSSFYLDWDMGEGKDHRVRFEAPWDYDSALGNRANYCEDAKGYYAYGCDNPWLTLLTGESFFVEMAKAKWQKLKNEGVFAEIFEKLHAYRSLYESEYAANFERWNHLGGNYSGTSGELRSETRNVNSEADACKFLEDWLGDRLTQLNGIYGDRSDLHCPLSGKETVPEGYQKTRYEAESGDAYGGARAENNAAASGGQYLGNLDEHANSGTRFSISVEEDTEAYIAYGLGKQTNSRDPQEMFELKVGTEVIAFPERRNAQASNARQKMTDWGEVTMGKIALKKGKNVLTIRSRGSATNLDYLDVYLPPAEE